jgi:hypothetical protein
MNFPFLINAIKRIPDRFLPGAIVNILEYQRGIRATIEKILADKYEQGGSKIPWVTNILNNPSLPTCEKTLDRITGVIGTGKRAPIKSAASDD